MRHILITIAAGALLSTPVFGWAPQGNNIKTKWAAEVGPENSRTEYPRPQMVRKAWKSLNGLWDYSITGKDASRMGGKDGEILVPFCIESSLSGVCKKIDKEQALWYRTTFEVPAEWAGKRILLHFDAVDWKAEVFLNDEEIGTHTGGYTSFDFDVTDRLKNGPAELVVKVWDPTSDPEYSIPRGKQRTGAANIWYTPVTGIWQSVWLEAVSDAYIDDYDVIASPDGAMEVDVDVKGEADEVRVEVLCPKIGYNPEKPAWGLFKKAVVKVALGSADDRSACVNASAKAALKVRRPKAWSPDSPWLYGLRIKLYKGGKLIDKVDGYTALRCIGEKSDAAGVKRLALNDRILFQLGPLDQGWWPDGLYTAPTAKAMAWDIIQTKALGFNMIRKHIKIEPARWYYDCDRLGVLVWQDMPCIGKFRSGDWAQDTDCYGTGRDYYALTDSIRENYYKEWGEIIAQRRKFPSIVVWIPFNEAWGQFDTKKVCEFTKALDPTRLINAASGGNWVEGAGEILDSHYYPNPEMRLLDSNMVNVLGEFGGIGRPIEGHTWDIGRKWGYVQYDSEEKVTDTYCLFARDLVDLKQNDWCAAAVYTQTTDIEGEVNGFFTYDREILKINMKRAREANLAVINAPDVPALPLVRPSNFHYKETPEGESVHYKLFAIRGGGLTMQVTDFGARIISLFAPDRDGVYDDVITGEKAIKLPQKNDSQTPQGGQDGVDMVRWKVVERTPNSVKFALNSPVEADGFPGNLDIELTYTLTDEGALDIACKATSDVTTSVNLPKHASGITTVAEDSSPTIVLRPGEPYSHHSVYKFPIRQLRSE